MIKFFRKIRQQLLTESNFRKYLLYALGEIVLVVIGIVIALQINNWNNNRLDLLNEKELIANIIQDLEYDHEILTNLIRQAVYKQELHAELYRKSTAEPLIDGNDLFSSEILELIFILSKTWDNHQGLRDELSDRTIRSDLNTYFSDYLVAKNYVEIHNDAVIQLRQYNRQKEILNLDAIFRSNPNEQSFDPYSVIRSDRMSEQLGTREFNSILVELYLSNQDVIQWMENLSNRNELLRSKLTEYLD